MSLSRLLAEYAINTPAGEVTSAARETGKKAILDAVGVSIAAWNAPGIPGVHEQMTQWGGAREASALVYGTQLPAPHAAFLNSVMAHAWDYDDLHDPAGLHLSCVLLPVGLATGERLGASGQDVLVAIILGFEVACRIGLPFNQRRGGGPGLWWLPTSVIGGFGATLAACRLLGLSVDQAVHALGINYAQAGGNRQALLEKTLTKRMQPAFAARNALWAASLAAQGLTGPEDVFEGEAGLFRVFINAQPPTPQEVMKKKPGDPFEIERNSIKKFTSCGHAHPLTQAAIELGREHHFQRQDLREVVICTQSGPHGENLTDRPFRLRNNPNPQVEAQFSSAYGVAVGLLRGKAGLAEFTNERVRQDTEVAQLAEQIRIVSHLPDMPEVERIHDDFPDHVDKPHVLIVRTADGRELRKVSTIRSILGPQAMNMETTIEKFHDCARFSGICSEAKASEIVAAVKRFEQFRRVSEFTALCALR
ncbi:MmgE/PrpD family protein [bacterium]|nr:MmgE/PrpD family protein [bacterium]